MSNSLTELQTDLEALCEKLEGLESKYGSLCDYILVEISLYEAAVGLRNLAEEASDMPYERGTVGCTPFTAAQSYCENNPPAKAKEYEAEQVTKEDIDKYMKDNKLNPEIVQYINSPFKEHELKTSLEDEQQIVDDNYLESIGQEEIEHYSDKNGK